MNGTWLVSWSQSERHGIITPLLDELPPYGQAKLNGQGQYEYDSLCVRFS
jgi:hypothetical protein